MEIAALVQECTELTPRKHGSDGDSARSADMIGNRCITDSLETRSDLADLSGRLVVGARPLMPMRGHVILPPAEKSRCEWSASDV